MLTLRVRTTLLHLPFSFFAFRSSLGAMSSTPTAPPPKGPRVPPALIGAGVLVIALGFGVPLLTSGSVPDATHEPAAAKAASSPVQPPESPNLLTALLRLLVGMAVVCGLCVVVARMIGPKAPPAPGAMDVVASIAVGPCVLHLVRAGERRLLVGTDPAGVKAVLELPGPGPEPEPPPPEAAAVEPAPSTASDAPPTRDEVLSLLLRMRGRDAAPPPG
jgi:hypothetical protein